MTRRDPRLTKIHAGAYEWHGRLTFTITRETDNPRASRWYIREGRYPGGPAFDAFETLRDAVGSMPPIEANDHRNGDA